MIIQVRAGPVNQKTRNVWLKRPPVFEKIYEGVAEAFVARYAS
jgi:hypothetical protein